MIVLDEFREECLFIAKIGMLSLLIYPANIGSIVSIKVVTIGDVHIVLV